jgi:hypothetical protein
VELEQASASASEELEQVDLPTSIHCGLDPPCCGVELRLDPPCCGVELRLDPPASICRDLDPTRCGVELEQAREEGGKMGVGGSSRGSGWDAAPPGIGDREGRLHFAVITADITGAATVASVALADAAAFAQSAGDGLSRLKVWGDDKG